MVELRGNLKREHQRNIEQGLTFEAEGADVKRPVGQPTTEWPVILDISPQAWRRAYVAALFAEDTHWHTAIEKYQMLVPGSRKNSRDNARDLTAKARLQEQVSIDTYEDRKAFFDAWNNAPCCADNCDQYCDECSNNEIQFKSVPAFGLDADIRRYITKYGRYQTKSELEENDVRNKSTGNILSGVRDGKSDNDSVWIRGQEGDGLFSQPEEVTSDQAERVAEMFLYPGGPELAT